MVLLYLNVGLRKSELFGLQWQDFNFETGVLKVQRQIQYLPASGLTVRPLKTDKSTRAVKLPASMIALLNDWYNEQQALQFSMGESWQERTPAHLRGNWIFISTRNFGPMHPDGFPKVLKHFLVRAGFSEDEIKYIHLHSLRHTNASILIAANTNITAVAKRLGHAQTSTTMDIYSHFVRQADEVAAEALDVAIHAARG
jgi:integrase